VTDLIQLCLAGVSIGAIYAMAAIGFVLLWQTSNTINFAQGEFVVLRPSPWCCSSSFSASPSRWPCWPRSWSHALARVRRQGAPGLTTPQDGRAAAGHRDDRAQPAHPVLAPAVLDARSPCRFRPSSRATRSGSARSWSRWRRSATSCRAVRHSAPCSSSSPGPSSAGRCRRSPRTARWPRARHQCVPPRDGHVRAERRAHRDRRDPHRADLPREVRHRRRPRLKAFYAAIIGGFNQIRGALLGGSPGRRGRDPFGRLTSRATSGTPSRS